MVGRARTDRTLEKQQAAFLAALEETANVTESCRVAKVPRRTVYDWRDADAAFRAAWDAALELGVDALEDEVTRRAFSGVDEPVFYQGAECGVVRKYSDTLAIFLLKARRPERFKDRAEIEHSGTVGLGDRLARARARRVQQAKHEGEAS